MSLLLPLFRAAMFGRARRFARDLHNPQGAQAERLATILRENESTKFGREYGFAQFGAPEAYRAAVPIRSYTDFAPYIEAIQQGETAVLTREPVTMFAITSGTASTPKFCPVTRAFTLEHHRSHLLWMRQQVKDHPRILDGSFLTLVSPAENGRTTAGIPYGSASGRQYLDQAIPIRRRHPVPYAAFTIGDYAARYHTILTFALGAAISHVTSVNPSTLVHLAGILAERGEALLADLESGHLTNAGAIEPALRSALERTLRPRPERARALREILRVEGRLRAAAVWPRLAALVTWQGGSAPFYLGQLAESWGDAPRRCLGLRASEGTFSIPLADHTPAAPLAVGGAFLEFIPADERCAPEAKTLLAHELEAGRRYRLIITTSGGFYRYDLADIVEVTGFRDATPEIAFLHKAGNVLSLTGEKVTEHQVVALLERLAPAHPPLAGFTVTLEEILPPRYLLAVEPKEPLAPRAAGELLRAFEVGLSAANEEYAEKRASGRLAPPELLTLAPESYRAHRAALVAAGRPDGQIKPPHLIQPASAGIAPRPDCPFFARVTVTARHPYPQETSA